ALLWLSREYRLYPTCFALRGLEPIECYPIPGSFGDIWKGTISGQVVALKVLRFFQETDPLERFRRIGREATVWRQLSHPNVLPFFGLSYLNQRLCLISPWMENGSISQYLHRNSPSTVDRLSLILDVALGLEYLHKNNVVHGDLTGDNILVTRENRACIADFGLSSLGDTPGLWETSTDCSSGSGGIIILAPELIIGDTEPHFGSDVYAFACLCYQTLTARAPFSELFGPAMVLLRVLDGYRPIRPDSWPVTPVLDNLWNLVQDCWKEHSTERPLIGQVVERLTGPSIGATTQPATDWDETLTPKFRRSLQTEPL
ncbi:kinase-like domain-containing protein, partial [Mycena sanguinolenta]